MQTVYLETSFVSYLTARPSRTIVGAAHQQITRDWWSNKRSAFELRISELVVRECAAGNPDAAQRRLAAIDGIARLEINEQVERIALGLVRRHLVPPQVAEDALHIAIAAAHGMDFILTWNFKHIANPTLQYRIAGYLDEINLALPFICTPEELLGEDNGTISD
ncbi:MAG: type II toxin-antitoxin system VapC family toxin [Methylococcaceae bacterium]|nr:type II toxin-antitoxin system VapC family toxin [Methylococcaceae bacterium]